MSEEVASRRLRAALDEQERLTRGYEQAIGTSSELTAYARLQAANLAVSNADRVARTSGAEDGLQSIA